MPDIVPEYHHCSLTSLNGNSRVEEGCCAPSEVRFYRRPRRLRRHETLPRCARHPRRANAPSLAATNRRRHHPDTQLPQQSPRQRQEGRERNPCSEAGDCPAARSAARNDAGIGKHALRCRASSHRGNALAPNIKFRHIISYGKSTAVRIIPPHRSHCNGVCVAA